MPLRKRTTILCLYSILLIVVVVLKFHGSIAEFSMNIQQNIDYLLAYGEDIPANYIPFRTLRMYLSELPDLIAVKNLLGNLIPWIPLGLLWRWRFSNAKIISVLAGLAAFCLCGEILQVNTYTGIFDIDDCLLNFVGCLIGLGLWRILRGRME